MTDEGRNPTYHRAVRNELRARWPSLYAAVETLVRERTVTEADCPCWGCQSREMGDQEEHDLDMGVM